MKYSHTYHGMAAPAGAAFTSTPSVTISMDTDRGIVCKDGIIIATRHASEGRHALQRAYAWQCCRVLASIVRARTINALRADTMMDWSAMDRLGRLEVRLLHKANTFHAPA